MSALKFFNFSLLGISNLIGWNVVLTSLDFFSSKFIDYDINFLMVIPCDVGSLLANFLIGFFIKAISLNKRIVSSLLLLAISIIILPLEAYLFPNVVGFWIFMLLNFLISGFMVFLQGSILGLAGNYSDYCMGSINFGFSISGVLTCLLRIICLLVWKNEQETNFYSILLYYSFSTLIVLVSLLVFLKFISQMANEKKNIQERLLSEINVETTDESELNEKEENSKIYRFFIQSMIHTLPYSFLMFLINVQTFLLFPGVALGYRIFGLDDAWNGVILLLIFNVFDAVGRYCSLLRYLYGKRVLSGLIFLRFLFIGTFFILFYDQNVGIINNGYFAVINMILFAFTNGYFITALFILPTEMYSKQREKELVSFMMSFMLNLGGIVGSSIALKFANL